MDKVLKTETNIQPVNGMILVKQVMPNISIIELTGGKSKKVSIEDRPIYYISGISVNNGYDIGQKVLLNEGDVSANMPITVKGNERSYIKLSKVYKDMKEKERMILVQSGERVDVVEYYIIHHGSVHAIVLD